MKNISSWYVGTFACSFIVCPIKYSKQLFLSREENLQALG
jgi:hypothetical protein